ARDAERSRMTVTGGWPEVALQHRAIASKWHAGAIAMVATATVVLSALTPQLAQSRHAQRPNDRAPRGAGRSVVGHAYARLPLAFEPNVGQTDPRVAFVAHGLGYTLFLTHRG